MTAKNDFYVYVLFDGDAIPRYVGKGRGSRWLQHDKANDKNNSWKNTFIRSTLLLLREIPKIKIRENMAEAEAFELERLLIKAIGRHPKGPLVNLTDKRNGPSSETMKAWWASATPEERSARAEKTKKTTQERYTPEERSERARCNNASVPREIMAKRMAAWQAGLTPEQRKANARGGGLASYAVMTEERKAAQTAALHRYSQSLTTPELRREHYRKSGMDKVSKTKLSEWGKKGVKTLNQKLTPEQRSANGRKGWLAMQAKKRLLQRTPM